MTCYKTDYFRNFKTLLKSALINKPAKIHLAKLQFCNFACIKSIDDFSRSLLSRLFVIWAEMATWDNHLKEVT